MPAEEKNFRGSLVLDFGIWWRHVKTIYTGCKLQIAMKCSFTYAVEKLRILFKEDYYYSGHNIWYYYMALSHKDCELPNSRIRLVENDIDRGLDFPI